MKFVDGRRRNDRRKLLAAEPRKHADERTHEAHTRATPIRQSSPAR